MALLESTLAPMGAPCPDFTLPGVDGRSWSRADFQAPALLVVVMCNHCPYVQAVDGRINTLAVELAGRCDVVGINPNDADTYREDNFEAMRTRAQAQGFAFPYLWDASQEVARSLGAVCTPDFFLYDQERRLRYRGRLDDNWKHPEAVVRRELHDAVLALNAGQRPAEPQRPSMGCSIKWRL